MSEVTESRTGREFQLVEFTDIYGKKCSLQQSSLAKYDQPGTSAVWLGEGENRMHLDEDLTRMLVGRLSQWLETGSIHIGQEGEPGL